MAVVSYDSKLKVHQDFTRDRTALQQAIGDAVKGKDDDGNWPSRIEAGEGPSLRAGLPRGNDLRKESGTNYDAVRLVAEASGRITGRKNLLLFTNGFAGRINTFGQYQPDPKYYPEMSRALNDNNVAVYPIDLTPAGTEHTLVQLHERARQRHGRPVLLQLHQLHHAARADRGREQRLLSAELPAARSRRARRGSRRSASRRATRSFASGPAKGTITAPEPA